MPPQLHITKDTKDGYVGFDLETSLPAACLIPFLSIKHITGCDQATEYVDRVSLKRLTFSAYSAITNEYPVDRY